MNKEITKEQYDEAIKIYRNMYHIEDNFKDELPKLIEAFEIMANYKIKEEFHEKIHDEIFLAFARALKNDDIEESKKNYHTIIIMLDENKLFN